MKSRYAVSSIALCLAATTAWAQTPAGWRGNGTGVSVSARPPVSWSRDTNVAWATLMPARSNSQPVIVGERLFVCSEPFDLLCLQLRDGKILWRRSNAYRDITDDRQWSRVEAELAAAVSLRKRLEETGSRREDLILLANGRILRASDGKVLKRVPGLANASPVVQDGVAYYIDVRAEAHDLPATLDPGAESLELKTRWSVQLKGGDIYASPIIHNGLIYSVSTQRVLNVIDAAIGQIVTTRRLTLGDQPVWPSLCLAGEYLYISSRDGTTLILEAGRQYQEVARNQLEYFISTPVFHGNRMFVRTSQLLYCVGGS